MGKSVVSAVLVTKIVTRTVMRLWAIGGGGGGGQEAGAISTADEMWSWESRSATGFSCSWRAGSPCTFRRFFLLRDEIW